MGDTGTIVPIKKGLFSHAFNAVKYSKKLTGLNNKTAKE